MQFLKQKSWCFVYALLFLFICLSSNLVFAGTNTKVKIISFDAYDVKKYTKLFSTAFSMGIKLKKFNEIKSAELMDGMIIYASSSSSSSGYECYSFDGAGVAKTLLMKKDSRVVIFYTFACSEILEKLFYISSANEDYILDTGESGGTMFVDGGVIFPPFAGLTLGFKNKPGYGSYYINTFLTPGIDGFETYSVISEKTGKSRIIAAKRKIGKGTVVLLPSIMLYLFNDDQFDMFNNDEAAKILLKWVAGMQ